jgi:hypothetical protein
VAEHHGVGVTPVTGRKAHVRQRFEHRKTGNQLLTDDLLRRQPPMTSVSTLSTDHTSPLTCDFKLAGAPCGHIVHW